MMDVMIVLFEKPLPIATAIVELTDLSNSTDQWNSSNSNAV